MKKFFKAQQKFGAWILTKFLGKGGNGEVWEARHNDGRIGAIKILGKVKETAYNRFRDETMVIESNTDIPGIVPLFEKHLPEQFTETNYPFYVMPVAETANSKLTGAGIEKKIDAMISIAETLELLHARGIAHRDIKPGNMLHLNGTYILSDFGLVDYPDKKDVTQKGEVVGPKWSMDPEMLRNPDTADVKASDVYSLAKTTWQFLTENWKGFDGQYSVGSVVELKNFYPGTYTAPIDDLLIAATQHEQNKRPNISEFKAALLRWKRLNEDFHEQKVEQWIKFQSKLFPASIPTSVVWKDPVEIVKILNLITSESNMSYMFLPGTGGLELKYAAVSEDKDFIELEFGTGHTYLMKPENLTFESFAEDPIWTYFRLEIEPTAPTGVYTGDTHEQHKKRFYEPLTQTAPGEFHDYSLYDHYEYSEEEEMPENIRTVNRFFGGAIVMFGKRSYYNLDYSTTDGRHNIMNATEFREYIQQQVNNSRIPNENL